MGPFRALTNVLAMKQRHSYAIQPVTRVPNRAEGESRAMNLGVSATGNILYIHKIITENLEQVYIHYHAHKSEVKISNHY